MLAQSYSTLTMHQAADIFIREIEGEFDESTIDRHNRALAELCEWLNENNYTDILLINMNRPIMRQYHRYLLTRPRKRKKRRKLSVTTNTDDTDKLSPFTVDRYMKSIKRFFNWLIEEEIFTAKNPTNGIVTQLPKVPPKYMTSEDCKLMLAAAQRPCTPLLLKARNRAICALWGAIGEDKPECAIGSGELSRLELTHIDGCLLYLVRLTNISRWKEPERVYFCVRLNPEQMGVLYDWLRLRVHIATCKHVFVTVDNRAGQGQGAAMRARAIYSAYFYESHITTKQITRRNEQINEQTMIQVRRYALLLFFVDTGCRLGGLVSLTRDRLDMVERSAIVYEKGRGGKKARTVFFSEVTEKALTSWLNHHKPEGNKRVFALSEKSARDDLNQLAMFAGVSHKIHNPHSIRHAFARSLLLQGVNLGVVSRMMGHSSVNVTVASYGVFDVKELQQVHKDASPVMALVG